MFDRTGTLTIGYWKNHQDKWPITTLPFGGSTISEATALTILNTPPRGDATIILAVQLIAAELNVALGNNSTCITSTIAAANALLASNPVGSHLSPSSTAGATAVSLGGRWTRTTTVGSAHHTSESDPMITTGRGRRGASLLPIDTDEAGGGGTRPALLATGSQRGKTTRAVASRATMSVRTIAVPYFGTAAITGNEGRI